MASSARMGLVFMAAAVLLAGRCSAVTDGLPRANSTGSELFDLGEKAINTFVEGIQSLPVFSDPLKVHFSRYADPIYDAQYVGTPLYYMGLGHGGCGYGNLLNQDKYPYLMAIALSNTTRKALGISDLSVGCGACVRISCPRNVTTQAYYCREDATPIVAVVADVCPEIEGHSSGHVCKAMHVDAYIKAWEYLGGDSNPEAVVERVMCPQVTENIGMYLMRNEGPFGFLKVVFQNVGGSGVLSEVQLICDGSKRIWLTNQYGAVWATQQSLSTMNACRFKLTTDDWATVETVNFENLKTGAMDEELGLDWVDVRDTGVQFGRPPATDGTTIPWTAPTITPALASTLAPLP